MAKRKGTISKIGKSKYSFYVLLDGDQFYFNTKYDPKAGVGDVVGIEFDKKADNRGQVKKITLLEDNGAVKGFQGNEGGSGGSGGGKYQADPDRQKSIIFQSSRKDALVATDLIVSNGAIALPKAADKRRTVIEALIDELTLAYYQTASNPDKALGDEKDVEDDSGNGDDDWDDQTEEDADWD